MEDILTDIVKHKREELKSLKSLLPINVLRSRLDCILPEIRSMSTALANSSTGIISEFKKKSPSKGWINKLADPEIVAASYEKAGASALSILTDAKYFAGSLNYIGKVRTAGIGIPILRKDFIIDEYQLVEARLAGADAVLLIAACLPHSLCMDLVGIAHSLGLETLLEIHSEEELSYLDCGSDMVGVNNRNLGSFVTDVNNSFKLVPQLRAASKAVLVSESGLSDPTIVKSLRSEGFKGFLMGEHFMSSENPGLALSKFIAAL
jgi:indole-3-glycerol phosphate synthase